MRPEQSLQLEQISPAIDRSLGVLGSWRWACPWLTAAEHGGGVLATAYNIHVEIWLDYNDAVGF
jgi:hypothetical protein